MACPKVPLFHWPLRAGHWKMCDVEGDHASTSGEEGSFRAAVAKLAKTATFFLPFVGPTDFFRGSKED